MKLFAALALALALATPALAQSTPAPADFSKCDAVAEITAYFEPNEAVVYKFDGANSAKLIATIEGPGWFGPMPHRPGSDAPTVMYLGLDLTQQLDSLFFYDAKGCFVNFAGGLPGSDVSALFDDAGVASPVGPTYYQLPGAPGAPSGLHL